MAPRKRCEKRSEILKINKFQDFLFSSDKQKTADIQITADLLIQKFYGQGEDNRRALLNTFKEHNEQCRKLIGIDFAPITVSRYDLCCQYLGELIKLKYNRDDLLLKEINGEFVRSFEFYMKTEKSCKQNTVIRYMKCLKKIINLALANEWMTKNPFAGIKFKEENVTKEFLEKEELEILIKKEHIFKDNSGDMWIRKDRHKIRNRANCTCNIPLLDIPIQILDKYQDHPLCKIKEVLLPVTSNQKMNSYLKEIADFCGIKKNLSTHVARHTFATTVTL